VTKALYAFKFLQRSLWRFKENEEEEYEVWIRKTN
jgi:hypothetical protein